MHAYRLLILALLFCAGCTNPSAIPSPQPTPFPTRTPNSQILRTPTQAMQNLIPKPTSITITNGVFVLNANTKISFNPAQAELMPIAEKLVAALQATNNLTLEIAQETAAQGNILLELNKDASLGAEGYVLTITPDAIALQANQPAGIFYGVQTLRQLVPPKPAEQIVIPAGTIRDVPRFAWRGAMLDVARHFFKVEDVKAYIDVLAHYKLNRLHLHLSDDQGWRIEIKSWDKLATIGGSTEVGGGQGGYYTQTEYQELVEYAAENFMLVIPEIDLPGHTNAALASYPELNCDGNAPALYTGTEVGFSSLCTDKEITYQFIDDVMRELAALTPGPFLHVGGDEARATRKQDYIPFIERVETIVQKHGKRMIGWGEIGQAELSTETVAQHWHEPGDAAQALQQGASVILSPASKAYLDMKYDADTKLGLDWAGLIDVEKAYAWEPLTELKDVDESKVLGVEAPLWSETLRTLDDIEYMAFPRVIGIAEIGWSAREGRNWNEYMKRLATHGARLEMMGVNFYRAPQVPWE